MVACYVARRQQARSKFKSSDFACTAYRAFTMAFTLAFTFLKYLTRNLYSSCIGMVSQADRHLAFCNALGIISPDKNGETKFFICHLSSHTCHLRLSPHHISQASSSQQHQQDDQRRRRGSLFCWHHQLTINNGCAIDIYH